MSDQEVWLLMMHAAITTMGQTDYIAHEVDAATVADRSLEEYRKRFGIDDD